MELAEKIYWCIAIPFSIVFIIQLVLTFIGGDFDDAGSTGDADASIDADEGIGFQFISIKNISGFFTIFSWTGIAAINAGKSMPFTIIVSVLAGLAMMTLMATLIYYMGKLSEDGTLKLNNAIGKLGTAYLKIPAQRKGMGKVQIKVQGYRTLDAITDDMEDIPTGAVVDVVDIINDEILLVKMSK
jgi:membrane protein implicated in regulation of membrane protease activity